MQLLTVAYFFSYFAAETLPSLFGPALGYLVTTTGQCWLQLQLLACVQAQRILGTFHYFN